MSAALQAELPISRMTAEQFLEFDPGDGRRWQLIDGELVAMNPPAHRDGRIDAEIVYVIGSALKASGNPCSVTVGPGVQPRIESKYNVRIPDLTVDCDTVGETAQLVHAPVLIAEILSPGNERVTRSNIWRYRSIPSVRTILLLYSWKAMAELSVRAGQDWPDAPVVLGPDDRLRLSDVGLDVRLAEVYATADLAPPA